MFMAQARTRQDHCGIPSITQVNRNAARKKLALIGLNHHVVLDAGAQVNSSRTGSGIAGHIVMQTLVENLDIYAEAFHFLPSLTRCPMCFTNCLATVILSAWGKTCLLMSSNITS